MMKFNFSNRKIFLLLLVTVFLSFSFKSKFFEVAKQIEIYNTLFKELNMYYVDEINPAELTNKAIKNTLKDLDPYTNFYNEQEVEDARIRREGEYGGIGVSVNYIKKGIQIREVYKGFAADKSELKAGDIIISVDDKPINTFDDIRREMMIALECLHRLFLRFELRPHHQLAVFQLFVFCRSSPALSVEFAIEVVGVDECTRFEQF